MTENFEMPLLLPLLLQITPLQPPPKSAGVPPAAPTEAAQVLAPVNALLGALETNDGATVLAVTRAEGGATAAFEGPNGRRGVRHLSWAEFAANLKPDGNRYSEHLSDPTVEIDGDIAYVWARYTVRKNGAIEHCGYDLFDVVRDKGQWKVLNVTWSQRTTGCEG